MSEADQIGGLETALIERARQLAEEYRVNGRQQHDRMVAEAQKRLREAEEHAVAAARAHAERAYRQQVQAAELELRAELDRLRLELVNTLLNHLSGRLDQLAADEPHYLPLLQRWLGEAAQAIESPELVVEFNARDLQRMKPGWDKFAGGAVPGKRLTLAAEPINCAGGVCVTSADRKIRVDDTFEGRRERLGDPLRNIVADELVPPHLRGGD